MAAYQCCRECGLSFGDKALTFHENKNENDNRDLFEKLNIVKQCCRNSIVTCILDPGYLQMRNTIKKNTSKDPSNSQ